MWSDVWVTMYKDDGTPNENLGGGGLILIYSSISLCKIRFYAIVYTHSINTGEM